MCSFNYAGGSFPTLPTPTFTPADRFRPFRRSRCIRKNKMGLQNLKKVCAYLVGSGLDICPKIPDQEKKEI
jgi:hypothetical protein